MKEKVKALVSDTIQTLKETLPPGKTLLVGPESASFFAIKSAIQKSFPQIPLTEKIPDDTLAKENENQWKKYQTSAEVILLSFQENEADLLFLKNLAKAIHTNLRPTKILEGARLEKEKKWELFFEINTPRLILSSEKALQNTVELKKLYKPATLTSSPLLSSTPLLLLQEPASYAQDKALKAQLWNALCQILKK